MISIIKKNILFEKGYSFMFYLQQDQEISNFFN